ncbi:MAG TPA: hypothetical protein VFE36_14605 [Candidatus Baltobacteraceae bacterium]|jgi:hypothetical protein|nr:hypothetical protein [Candidatus Baltobacteraceae bacterium]
MRFLALALLLLVIAPVPSHSRYLVAWGMETKSYPGDRVGHDFLAVFDIDDSAQFGHLVAFLPVATRAQMAHHTNYAMPSNHMLFANDFMAGRTYVFDLRNPQNPRVAASFGNAGPYTHAHSFAYLSNGNVLATYQIKGWSAGVPGGLVEMDRRGRVLRTSSAAAPQTGGFIRPYSLVVIENMNRVVTTSAAMPPLEMTEPSRVVQIWRLSDLKLLKTVVLPKPKRFKGVASQNADEAALLADGSTVLVKTSACGLYRINGVEGSNPSAEFVYDFGYRSCSGVPIVVGNYWIQPSMSGHSITSLDVRDPSHPVEAGHLYLGGDAIPHWMALEPGTGNLVVTGFGSMLNRIVFAAVDPQTGTLTLDARTIDFNRKWPDGWTGPSIPHGTLFY